MVIVVIMNKILLVSVCAILLSSCCWFSCHDCGNKLVVINVLDPEFYSDCHIVGSINIPFDQVEQRAATLNKDAEVVVYCSNYRCTASAHAARILQQQGFKRVYAYEAGMAEWYQQKLPVAGPCKQAYLTMENKMLAVESAGGENTDVKVISTQELKQKLDAQQHAGCSSCPCCH